MINGKRGGQIIRRAALNRAAFQVSNVEIVWAEGVKREAEVVNKEIGFPALFESFAQTPQFVAQIAASIFLAGIRPQQTGQPFAPLGLTRVQEQIGEQRLSVSSGN